MPLNHKISFCLWVSRYLETLIEVPNIRRYWMSLSSSLLKPLKAPSHLPFTFTIRHYCYIVGLQNIGRLIELGIIVCIFVTLIFLCSFVVISGTYIICYPCRTLVGLHHTKHVEMQRSWGKCPGGEKPIVTCLRLAYSLHKDHANGITLMFGAYTCEAINLKWAVQ